MPTRKSLASEDRLAALRMGDSLRSWSSLDESRSCILCDRTFSGRQIEISISALGLVRLCCPSEGCSGTPTEWIYPRNFRISDKGRWDGERIWHGPKQSRPRRELTEAIGSSE